MRILKTVLRMIIGVIFGAIAGLALVPAFAAFADGTSGNTAWIFFVVIALGALLGAFAPTMRRAFGRGFLLAGASVFALPLSTMLLSGRVAADMVSTSEDQAAAAIGSGLAGTMLTGASALIGFFFGSILLIVGLVLVLGGRREVIVIERQSGSPSRREPVL